MLCVRKNIPSLVFRHSGRAPLCASRQAAHRAPAFPAGLPAQATVHICPLRQTGAEQRDAMAAAAALRCVYAATRSLESVAHQVERPHFFCTKRTHTLMAQTPDLTGAQTNGQGAVLCAEVTDGGTHMSAQFSA